ncbi:MAG TPA: PKD domain-containing protein [Nocardioidaceae bacterium]|nr:PKD domain-containing protein [Nocardioidaceae bacterium]
MNTRTQPRIVLATVIGVVSALVSGVAPASTAPPESGTTGPDAWKIRSILTNEFGVNRPLAVAWDPGQKRLVVAGRLRAGGTRLVGVTPDERPRGKQVLPELESEAGATAALNPRSGRLTVLREGRREAVLGDRTDERPWPEKKGEEALSAVDSADTTYSPDGTLHVLDAESSAIVSVSPSGAVRRVEIQGLDGVELAGIAYQPVEERLYVADADAQQVYALDDSGEVAKTQDLSDAGIAQLQAMTFAPSSDSTDAKSDQSLFVADAGDGDQLGSISELSLSQAVTVQATAGASLDDVIVRDTSTWSPPSPDPSGITYLPDEDGRLLVSDGEVEEMPIYGGANLFVSNLEGELQSTGDTQPWSTEPVGLEYDRGSGRLFVSDDVARRVFEVAGPGADGRFGTPDDPKTSFRTAPFGSSDPEGVGYDSVHNELIISDGVNVEVYRVNPGANGKFDGIGSEGDDVVTHFDVERYGVKDPEGVTYDDVRETIVLVSDDAIWELDANGSQLNTVDISNLNIHNTAGITIAPASDGSGKRHYYVVSRGEDNNSDPNENDGKLYELEVSLPAITNRPPTANAGPDQMIDLSESVRLSGSGSDDGNPSGTLTYRWSMVSGPGTVRFTTPTSASTDATFSAAGAYTLRLTVSDSQMTGHDDVVVNVYEAGGVRTASIPLRSSPDDAMEGREGGGDFVSVTRADNELGENVTTAGVRYSVLTGLRFADIPVPQRGEIVSAKIQFKVDEPSTGAAALTIKGEAVDNAAAYQAVGGDISRRPSTTATAQWAPPTWSTRGEAGPGQLTSELAPVLQEIVNRPGWQQGNAAAFVVSGTGRRTAVAFDGGGVGPVLQLQFRTSPPAPANKAPVVDAGVDQSVTLPSSATLDGTVTDDGRPAPPGAVTTAWSKVDGPGTVAFGDAAKVDTTASFSQAGSYTLRLTANDSALDASDTVVVTVSDEADVVPRLDARLTRNLVSVGARSAVTGTISSSADGQPLRLQRWNGSTWRTVQRKLLPAGDNVRYRFTVRQSTSGVYRFRVAAPPYAGSVRAVAPSRAKGLRLRVYRLEIVRVQPFGDEFVRVRNTGRVSVVLDGWQLRNQTTGRTVRLTPVKLLPRWSVRIHTGTGRSDRDDLYLGKRRQMWRAHGVAVLRDRYNRLADRYRY